MHELGPNAWKTVATMEQVEGVRFNIIGHSLWSNMSSTLFDAYCTTPSTLSDQMDCSRLIVMLDQVGGRVEIGPHSRRRPIATRDTKYQMSFGPPGAPQWGFFSQPSDKLRWITLLFDLSAFADQMDEELVIAELCPRYMFFDPRILQISRLIEAETMAGQPATTLYFDTLALSLVHRLAQSETTERRPGARYLPPRQRKMAIDYMRTNLSQNIRLAELAALVGLTPSGFCRAFKASVGLPPHAWQLRERIRMAQASLLHGAESIADLSVTTGFADQAHFTRVFRKMVGTSPHAWRRMHRH